jgi:hypothetical protein
MMIGKCVSIYMIIFFENLWWIRYKGIIDDIVGPNTSICIYPKKSMDTMG